MSILGYPENHSDIQFHLQISLPIHRAPNEDTEPNEDFGSANIIQYNNSGTTHIFNASVGGSDICDFWSFNAHNGTPVKDSGNNVVGSNNPEKVSVMLSFNEINMGSNGVYMTIYDAEFHELGVSSIAIENNPQSLDLIGQVNPNFYIKVQANPPDYNFKYILTFINSTTSVSLNPAYGDNEKFESAIEVNLTKGRVFNGDEQYLDKSYDFADFYKFDAVKNQKIEIELAISSKDN
jgi:hypothetical protein